MTQPAVTFLWQITESREVICDISSYLYMLLHRFIKKFLQDLQAYIIQTGFNQCMISVDSM